ncbi:hypothetical protein PAXRUDRAFT_21074 [Paxillus rubicundulus Ve08.2h10]|uniref:Uncharacterized protein n=1 Tax=Paxillus rubicundulus Ve08.2h10 TaxID=930991 RepID=A0A0D0D098_9AGAM|nr:hypothetical protein PAXRUDRAFT_21074 [Paxillus rubicundulus Ve08.2h10]
MDSERALQLRGRRKAEVQTPGSWESGDTNSDVPKSGVGVSVPEFTSLKLKSYGCVPSMTFL